MEFVWGFLFCFGVEFFVAFKLFVDVHISKSLGQMWVSWEKNPNQHTLLLFFEADKTNISPSLIIITAF